MVKVRCFLAVGLILLGVAVSPMIAFAEVVVNEAMVNEPGRVTNLEWFELYVDSDEHVSLGGYRVVIGEDTISFPDRSVTPPHTFIIVCRKLVTTGGGASFEGHWGDSSGLWGDTPEEEAFWWPTEAVFSLSNAGGAIEVFQDQTLVSAIRWIDPGADGVSWERTEPTLETVVPSVDIDGSTPGFVNSVTPVGSDLSIDAISLGVENGWTTFDITIANRGLLAQEPKQLHVYYAADPPSDPGDLILDLAVPSLAPGQSIDLAADYPFDGMYVSLAASLPDDDRLRNNRRAFTAPAAEFPPFIMTEMLPRPTSGAQGEWIEIVNPHYEQYDLLNWRVGDDGREETITDTSIIVPAGKRIVLMRSASAFAADYPDFDGLLIKPTGWSPLNDDGDTVCLVDPFDLEADRFVYNIVFDDNYTWCRGEQEERQDQWGRSEEAGGSPGRANSVMFGDDAGELTIAVTPEVFSPDGDGYEDSVVISIDGPDTRQFELKIYDRQGRMVRRLDQGSYRLDTYVWRGRSDSGARLPVGVYILYCEIEGVGSVKKPIVIAR